MTLLKNSGSIICAVCLILLAVAPVSAVAEYNISQTLSDQAQQNTIAFDALAFITGDTCSDTFLPPGKVADYAGFQYLRDNDLTHMGHNTDFVTRASDNVLYILNDDERSQFITLASTEKSLTTKYGYMRYPLMKAFRAGLSGTIPAGSTGLDRAAVMAYSAELYGIDADISIARAKTYASVIRSLNTSQRAYLDAMKSKGMLNWPVVNVSAILKNSGQDNQVALRTYASEMFAWYAGSVEADVYFCPERQGTYFGSFYMKDRPAMGNDNYSISTSLTGDAGEKFLAALNQGQRSNITGLVDRQRTDLYEIVSTREEVSTELRRALSGGTIDEAAVRTLSARYGEFDGELSYYYATRFAETGRTVNSSQMKTMVALRNLTGYTCNGGYLYSQSITYPQNIPSDFLLGVGSYNATEMAAWVKAQETIEKPLMILANFTARPRTGIAPLTVQFTDTSSNNPGSWKWDFGDGSAVNATRQNPVHTFARAGTYTIHLTASNAAGSNTSAKTAFITVTAPASPTITGLTPSSGVRGRLLAITNLSGTNFAPGAKVSLNRTGWPLIYATNVTVISPAKITCTFPIPATAPLGLRNVEVKNTNGMIGTRIQAFMVRAPSAPTVTGITPNTGRRGTLISISNLSGTGFVSAPGPTVQFIRNTTIITATNVTVKSPQNIACSVKIPAGAAVGSWSVRVMNGDRQYGQKTAAFTVMA
jgi:PKD repeat protein